MASARIDGSCRGHDDADADGLNWELTPQESAGYGRAIEAALARDLAVAATAGSARPRRAPGRGGRGSSSAA
jgi:hypothetical protein